MLPFFRKIRWRLAANNQFFKYSRYAIGEIVLVVIGILIALYINNWNEQRKETESMKQVLLEVEKELITNISRSRINIQNLFFDDSIYQLVINRHLKAVDYKKDSFRTLSSPMAFYNELIVADVAFDKLMDLEGKVPTELDSILKDLSVLYTDRKQFVEVFNRQVHRIVLDNYETLFTKQSWYRKWQMKQEVSESEIQFFLEDEEYLNRAMYTSLIAGGAHRNIIETFELLALNCYRRIHKYLETNTTEHRDSILFDYDPNDYRHYVGKYVPIWRSSSINYSLDSTVISLENDRLYYTPYYNGTNTKREIIPVDKNKFRTVYSLGYYHVSFDDNGKVTGIGFGNGSEWQKSKKIH